ncbi:MAG TPA: DUF3108 domain-containing protein [Limnobacter sp.]|nr:DUF3108 domain-containing protein [Limnobacter sp.]
MTLIQNMTRKTRLAALLALLFAAPAWAAGNSCKSLGRHVADTDLRFSLTHSQVPGELATSSHKLRVAGTQYKLESTSQAKGLLALLYSGQLTQKSEGLVDAQLGLTPLYYSEQRGKKPLAETLLNAETQKLVFKRNGETAPYEKGLQDRLSMIYQLSARLRCSNDLKQGDQVTLRVMSTGRVGTEVFRLQKSEELLLNLGQGERKVSSLQFETKPEEPGDEIVRIWFSKDLEWQPVKIQIMDSEGKSITQTLIGMGPQKS